MSIKEFLKFLIFGTIILTFSSCASIFNSRNVKIKVVSYPPCNIIVNNDTLCENEYEKHITITRNSEPLIINAFNDTITKKYSIKPKNSLAFWLNINTPYYLGFMVDIYSKKRYTYPKTVYFDINEKDNKYYDYNPHIIPYEKIKNIIKFTPFKIIDITNPAIEFSYERKLKSNYSTQVMYSYLLPFDFLSTDFKAIPNVGGNRFSIEGRKYLNNNSRSKEYIGIEMNYMNKKDWSIWSFGVDDIYSDSTYNYTNYLDTFGIKKQTLSLNFKIGFQHYINRFSFEIYTGFGLRFRNVQHFDRLKPEDEMEMPRELNAYYSSIKEGKNITICIPLNFSIGWLF